MKNSNLTSHSANESMLSFLELELKKYGVAVEFSSSISTVKVGRNRPPCIYFYAKDVSQTYKIHLATVLAAEYGHGWKLSAFFPSKSERLDAKERESGQLRFILEPHVEAPSLFQSVLERFNPYVFRVEMAVMSQALIEVNKPGWVVPVELIRRGYVSKHE